MNKKRVTCIQCGKDMVFDFEGKVFSHCHCPSCHYAVYVEAENNKKGGKTMSSEPFYKDDIKSAVEGCLEAVLDTLDVSSITRSDDVDRIRDIFKKWFHDVM